MHICAREERFDSLHNASLHLRVPSSSACQSFGIIYPRTMSSFPARAPGNKCGHPYFMVGGSLRLTSCLGVGQQAHSALYRASEWPQQKVSVRLPWSPGSCVPGEEKVTLSHSDLCRRGSETPNLPVPWVWAKKTQTTRAALVGTRAPLVRNSPSVGGA